ncbi:MAG: N-acetyltransferase [Verrucomicrobiae bacterium]|nr:N-acetyltransferase [Verrucomicrobiae bacterium]
MQIRVATKEDVDAIRSVHISAFSEAESALIAKLAVELLSEETNPPVLSLVAETDGEVVGHVALSPVMLDGTETCIGQILAPLAVAPNHQGCGIGTRLIKSGIEQVSKFGGEVLLVYGDPEYYGRFGFRVETATDYLPPYPLQYPFGWQGIDFRQGEQDRQTVRIACVASLSLPVLW